MDIHTNTMSYETLCNRMDHLSLKFLELMDQLIRTKLSLEEYMRTGFLLLGKTRYILGNKSVSALQLPNEEKSFSALAVAHECPKTLEDYDGDVTYQKVEMEFLNPLMKLDANDWQQKHNECDGASNKVPLDLSTEGVRRRLGTGIDNNSATEDIVEGNSHQKLLEKEQQSPTVNVDPIRWFSVLPPQTLRQSQDHFRTSIQLCAQCATLQSQLRTVCREYKRLREIGDMIDHLEKEQ